MTSCRRDWREIRFPKRGGASMGLLSEGAGRSSRLDRRSDEQPKQETTNVKDRFDNKPRKKNLCERRPMTKKILRFYPFSLNKQFGDAIQTEEKVYKLPCLK